MRMEELENHPVMNPETFITLEIKIAHRKIRAGKDRPNMKSNFHSHPFRHNLARRR
jgi:hypothetical protein